MASTQTGQTISRPSGEISEPSDVSLYPEPINIGQNERFISTLVGGLLALYGLRRLHWTRILLVLLGGELLRRGLSGRSYLYQALGINTVHERPSTITTLPHNRGIAVRRSLTIEKPADELYRLWRDVEQAPLYMRHIRAVQVIDERNSHWIGQLPGGAPVEWDAEITQDIPNRQIAWRTTGGSLLGTGGQITFTPRSQRQETVVTVEMFFPPVAGAVGIPTGTLFARIPEYEVHESLRRFKALAETGEIPTTERR